MFTFLEILFPDWLRERLNLRDIFQVWTIYKTNRGGLESKSRPETSKTRESVECHAESSRTRPPSNYRKQKRNSCEDFEVGNYTSGCYRCLQRRESSSEDFRANTDQRQDEHSHEPESFTRRTGSRTSSADLVRHLRETERIVRSYKEFKRIDRQNVASTTAIDKRDLVTVEYKAKDDEVTKSQYNNSSTKVLCQSGSLITVHSTNDCTGIMPNRVSAEPTVYQQKPARNEDDSNKPPVNLPHPRHRRSQSLFESFGSSRVPYEGVPEQSTTCKSSTSYSSFGTRELQTRKNDSSDLSYNSTSGDNSFLLSNIGHSGDALFNIENSSPFVALMSAHDSRYMRKVSRKKSPHTLSTQDMKIQTAPVETRNVRSAIKVGSRSTEDFNKPLRRSRSWYRKPSRRQQRNSRSFQELQLNVLANVRFEEKFRAFARAGNKEAIGITMSCSNHLNWLRQAGVCTDEFTEMASQIAFKEASGAKTVISIHEYRAMLKRLAELLSIDYFHLLRRITNCGYVQIPKPEKLGPI